MLTEYPELRAARSSAASVDAGPNNERSNATTPRVRERPVVSARATGFAR